jgi:hypothetical protein
MPEHDRPIQRPDLGSIHPKGHNEPEPTRCFKGETMTREARMMFGIILITVPTIQYGGYFLTSLMDKGSVYMENPLRQNFFRPGMPTRA